MMMPVSSELFSAKVRWPVFLLANKVMKFYPKYYEITVVELLTVHLFIY